MVEALIEQRTVVLTASPLQRTGAFALAALARVAHPDELTVEKFDSAVERMTAHLLETADADKPADRFWLAASYTLWPNSSINPTARGRQSQAERRESISKWRQRPDVADWPAAQCTYCDRPACGWYGKVDIPLGASVEHRNTTAPGHFGTPLCFACVASLWAFPYGADLAGGRAAVIHSWDDTFLARMTRVAVDRTLRAAQSRPVKVKSPPYGREEAVLQQVRAYDRRITDGVELIVLSNANKDPFLRVQEMTQPVVEWIRSTTAHAERRAGYATLLTAQASKAVPGQAWLAKRAFGDPAAILHRTIDYVRECLSDRGIPTLKATVLAPLVNSYCIEVLDMDETDVTRIDELATRLAALLGRDDRPGPFREFVRANAKGGNLDAWFRTTSVNWLLKDRPEGMPPVLLSAKDHRLLFDGEQSWSYRRLLFFAVIEALADKGWKPKGSPEEIDEMAEEAGKPAADNNIEG